MLNPPEINDVRKLKIIDFIRNHPNAVYADIAQRFLISERTVGSIMRELVSDGIITRAGTRKKGSWVIK